MTKAAKKTTNYFTELDQVDVTNISRRRDSLVILVGHML